MNFYESWLATSARLDETLGHPPVVARGRDLTWIETPQDARVAMIIGDAVGFPTQGTSLLKAEIPARSHTGKHAHGEEAIHVLAGRGFSVIDGARYDWKPGTTLHVPYRAEHQHFNTGDEPATYLSASTMDLDNAVKLGRLLQLEEKGPNPPDLDRRYPASASQHAADGRRIRLHLEDAIDEGVDYLVRTQSADGSWGQGRDTTDHDVMASVPGSHDAFRVGTTALCIRALRARARRDSCVPVTIRRRLWARDDPGAQPDESLAGSSWEADASRPRRSVADRRRRRSGLLGRLGWAAAPHGRRSGVTGCKS